MKKNLVIRELRINDRVSIKQIVEKTGFFDEEETKTAVELIDCALKDPHCGYNFGIGEIDSELAGYVCFGQRPLTESAYDLYWIVVNPGFQNSGVGKKLMNWAEQQIKTRGGTLVLAETSGRTLYEPTRNFYLKIGYLEEARIKDFYKKGDDLVMFTKRL
ncbi:MAG: GNAT family N-acetyltransferase [Candidatus Riflebacteria bacterium]|nr:GNAT family N-acetyltransferase [Candidatus Riflebacteria bacterium]